MAAARKPKVEPPKPLQTHGLKPQEGWRQIEYDCYAFARRRSVDQGAPTRLDLMKSISEYFMPGRFEWHEWTEKIIGELCDIGTPVIDPATKALQKSIILLGVPGCSGAAKTFNIVTFACNWWLVEPNESSVMLVSTSKGSLRRRGWSEVTKCHTAKSGQRFGNFVDSRMMWQATKGDDKHAIVGKAVEEGSTQKVADDIKGVHTKRQMVIIDEATAVPGAIYEACANLYSYPEEFILVLIGNPLNMLDQFGRFCEPKDGFSIITPDTVEWEGRPQESLGGRCPRVIRFDAEKSPNILKGRLVSKHLPTKEDVEAAKKASGGGATPLYWQNFRGMWPPEGLTKTVFSLAMMRNHDAYGKHTFTGRNFCIIGSFDHARDGGDRPMLRFAKLGETVGGDWGIECMKPMDIPIDAGSSNPIDFQLAEQVKRQCEKFTVDGTDYECLPENFAVDETGAGAGFCDILQRIWSNKFIRIQFGSAASTDTVSLEDIRPANEVYLNKRAEMYFRTANFIGSNQLKGIDREPTAQELVNIQFVDLRPDGTSSPRVKLMSKKEYKAMYKKSPDAADTVVMLSEPARRRGFQLAAIGQTKDVGSDWDEDSKKAQDVYSEMHEPEEHFEEGFA